MPTFDISRPTADSPYVLWGGRFPSGSLKYLTFRNYFDSLEVGDAPGVVELSGACTALALAQLAGERDLECVAVCDPGGREYLVAKGFVGDIVVPASVPEAFQLCETKAAAGWIWPRQMCNPGLIDCVETWARSLLAEVREIATIKTIVTGFGTGATAVGLHNVFAAAGYDVLAVECDPGVAIPGWRNYDAQNLGEMDLFYNFRDAVTRVALPAQAPTAPLAALLSRDYAADAAAVLIVGHDAAPGDG